MDLAKPVVQQRATSKLIFVNHHDLQRRYHSKQALINDKPLRYKPPNGAIVMILTMETTLATTARLMVG